MTYKRGHLAYVCVEIPTLATPVVSEDTPYSQHNYPQCHIRFLHGSRAERTSHKISKINDSVRLDNDHCWVIYFCVF